MLPSRAESSDQFPPRDSLSLSLALSHPFVLQRSWSVLETKLGPLVQGNSVPNPPRLISEPPYVWVVGVGICSSVTGICRLLGAPTATSRRIIVNSKQKQGNCYDLHCEKRDDAISTGAADATYWQTLHPYQPQQMDDANIPITLPRLLIHSYVRMRNNFRGAVTHL